MITSKPRISNSTFYILAILGAFVLFGATWLLFSGVVIAAGFLINYWIFFVAGIVGLLILRKILSKKKEVVREVVREVPS